MLTITHYIHIYLNCRLTNKIMESSSQSELKAYGRPVIFNTLICHHILLSFYPSYHVCKTSTNFIYIYTHLPINDIFFKPLKQSEYVAVKLHFCFLRVAYSVTSKEVRI